MMASWVDFGETNSFFYYEKENKSCVAELEADIPINASIKRIVLDIFKKTRDLNGTFLKKVYVPFEKNLFFVGFEYVQRLDRSTKDYGIAKDRVEALDKIVCDNGLFANLLCELVKKKASL